MTGDVNRATLILMTTRTNTDYRLVLTVQEVDRIAHLIRVGSMALRDSANEARAVASNPETAAGMKAFSDSMARDFDRGVREGNEILDKIENLRYVGTLAFTGEPEEIDEMLGILAEQDAGCDCGKGLYCPTVQAAAR